MRRESPIKRRNPSGQIVWVARYTGRDGRKYIAKPTWNRGKGTFTRKADAQKAIDEAYGLSDRPDTLGDYSTTWTGSICLCIVLWIRAKTIGEDEWGNAERRAIFVGLWPPMFWLISEAMRRAEEKEEQGALSWLRAPG
jgi:hypothetical protein